MKRTIVILLVSWSIGIGQTKVGSTAAPFLNVGIGPRAISMGGAFVATANDVTTLYWNPAGASRMESNGAFFGHTRWFADITYNWAGIVLNLGGAGAAGLSLTYLDYGKIEVTTDREQDGTGEFYSAHDLAAAMTYSYNVTDRFSMGMNVKYINQFIYNSSADAFAVDLGTLFLSDISGIRIGATISNFGTDMQLDGKDLFILYDSDPAINGNNDQVLAKLRTDAFPLPLAFRVGLAKDFTMGSSQRVTLEVDAIHPNDNAESVNLGAEYAFNENILFRAGYKSLGLQNSDEGLTLGVGLRHDFSPQFGISVDYAYQDFNLLNYTQHFSVGVKF